MPKPIEILDHKEIEQTVIGLLFYSIPCARFIVNKLFEDDFHTKVLKEMFVAAQKMIQGGKDFDMVLFNDHTKWQYYMELAEACVYGVSDELAVEYINRLKELKIDRKKTMMLQSNMDVEAVKAELDILEREKVTAYLESEINSDLVKKYFRGNQEEQYRPGFRKLSDCFNIELGQFGIISGIPSHGKTTMLNQIVLNVIDTYMIDMAICSPESAPVENHIAEFISIDIGRADVTDAQIEKSEAKIREYIQFIDLDIQKRTLENIIGSLNPDIKILIIDPWNELSLVNNRSISDTDFIGERLQFLKNEAKKRKICIIVVAHPTKVGRDKDGQQLTPRPYDIFGSSNFANKADFILMIWRTKEITELQIAKIRYSRNGRMGEVIKFKYIDFKFEEV